MSLKDLLTKTLYVTAPSDPDPFFHPRTYAASKEEVVEAVRKALGSLGGWTAGDYKENQGRFNVTHRSLIPPFVEDVHLYVVKGMDGTVRLEAVSQSRGGRGDWGQNKRNLRALLTALDRILPPRIA